MREEKVKWWLKREETLGKIWKHFRGIWKKRLGYSHKRACTEMPPYIRDVILRRVQPPLQACSYLDVCKWMCVCVCVCVCVVCMRQLLSKPYGHVCAQSLSRV